MVLLRHVIGLAGLLQAVTASPSSRAHHGSRRHNFGRRDLSDTPANGTESAIIQGAYTIELNDGASVADVDGQLDALGISIRVRRVLDSSLFKGVSFNVINDDANSDAALIASTILQATAVKQVWPVRKVQLPPDDKGSLVGLQKEPGNQRVAERVYDPHLMTQVDLAHKAGFTGKGVKIAVIDTGIDYTHPLLGGCFGSGCLVESGYDTVGVDIIPWEEELEGDDDPMDCHGHGTHVAGIISALPNDLGFKGVAPGAKLSAYRVLDCWGGGTDETVVEGMLRAFDDGNDILSLSLGRTGGFAEALWSITATRIVEAGVPVFVAVGNSGYYEMFEPGTPSDGELVSSVASYNPNIEPAVSYLGEFTTAEGETESFTWVSSYFDFAGADELALPVINLNSFTTSNSSSVTGCSPLPPSVPDLSGHLVLVEGTEDYECFMWQFQEYYIYERGGRHILFWLEDENSFFFNNDRPSGDVNIAWIHGPGHKLLREALSRSNNVTVTLDATPMVDWSVNEVSGGDVSDFSSWGPNWDMRSAPSFGAPGHNILSTWPGREVRIASGTSMSTPLVAGAAALLIEARGTRDPKTIHNLLASTAKQVPLAKSVFGDRGGLHPPTQAGTGIIQLLDAVQAKGLLSTTGISFNDSDHHASEITFSLKNTGSEDATYSLGHTASLTTYAMDTQDRLAIAPYDSVASSASLSFSPGDSIRVSAGSEARITVRCEPPQGGDVSRWPIYSGYITLNGTNGDNLSISYVGNAGPMREGVIIPTRVPDNFWYWRPNEVFRIPRPIAGEQPPSDAWWDEYPFVDIVPRLRTRTIRVDLVPSNGTYLNSTSPLARRSSPGCHTPRETWLGEKTFGQVWESPFYNVLPEYFRPAMVTVTGHLANGEVVPAGRYQLMVSALGVFRDTTSNSTEDWQVLKSTPFFLEYKD